VLSLVTVAIDRRNENGLLSQSIVGNATDAQSILTTIATAVVTLTSIVLTVTLVAVQLATGQFSPRIVRALLDDRRDQIAIAVFGATFTFAVFSLRAVDTGPGGAAVPGLTMLTALALAAASAFALFTFVHHASQQLRVGARVDRERGSQLIALDNERTHTDDPAYGFRKLVDVAQRALGTASNDATTAVQVVNRPQDCLRQIADRPFPNGHIRGEDDELRL